MEAVLRAKAKPYVLDFLQIICIICTATIPSRRLVLGSEVLDVCEAYKYLGLTIHVRFPKWKFTVCEMSAATKLQWNPLQNAKMDVFHCIYSTSTVRCEIWAQASRDTVWTHLSVFLSYMGQFYNFQISCRRWKINILGIQLGYHLEPFEPLSSL